MDTAGQNSFGRTCPSIIKSDIFVGVLHRRNVGIKLHCDVLLS